LKRKTAIAVAIVTGLCLMAGVAAAHPPSGMDLAYDGDTGLLSVDVTHPVGNVASHFIDEVIVTVDGELVAQLRYFKQATKEGEKILVNIGMYPSGAVIRVKAECNKYGDMEKELIVGGAEKALE